MATVRELIADALTEIGVISADETPTAADLQTCFNTLNRMIDSWANENLTLYELPREVFELVSGKSIYSFGDGQDFETSRPIEILGAKYGTLIKTPIYEMPEPTGEDPDPEPVLVGYDLKVDYEYPSEVIDYQKWMSIPDKTLSSTYVGYVYPFGSAPYEKVQVYPKPSGQIGLVLYSKKVLSRFADVDVEVTFPPGYEQALVENLAVKVARKFGRQLDPMLVEDAKNSKAVIKRQNVRIPRMKSDACGLSVNTTPTYNILIGGRD